MAESIPVQCPACGASLSLSQQMVGQTVTCPACRAAVVPVATSGMPIPVAYASATNVAPTSGMAIASLVLGCLFCIPLTGVLALIFGIIALKQTRERQASGRGMAIAGTVLSGLNLLGYIGYFALMVAIMVPSLNRARETANRVRCASNMRQIGQAMLLYSNRYNGAYPPDLTTLGKNDAALSPNVFVCPSGNETPAQNWLSLETGGHLSYIYVGGNLTSSMAPGTVVLYENPAEHGGSGMNTLFGDGHVEFFGMVQTQKILQQLKAGHNPPTLTTGP